MTSLPLPTPILSQPEAIKELLQLAESSSKGEEGGVRGWCKEVERLTASLSPPNFRTIKHLFGKEKAESIYTLFPTAALAVTAAFIRTVSTNRLGKYVSRPISDLSPTEVKLKNGWEDALAEIIGSIADWCEWAEDKKAKSYVGLSVYPSIGMLLSNTSSKRLGHALKKAVLEIFESTLAETKSNRPLFLDAGQGVMGPRKLGDLLLAKPVHQASHLLTLDIVAHCLPKGIEERKSYVEIIFRSLEVVDVRGALETLLTSTSKSEFIQTRPKILKILAKFDVDRLQLFPLLSATRSSDGTAQLLASKDDRSLIKKSLKFVYLDSTSVVFSYSEDDAEKTVSVPFDAIVMTRFEAQGDGDDRTTTLIITDDNGETFKYKLKCLQSTIQRVCASRPFKTPVKPPAEDLRSFHRASTMEATGITLRSPEIVKRERESVPPAPADRYSQRSVSVVPGSAVEEEQVGESSQSAVRSQKERIEVMKGLAAPSQSSGSRDGSDKSMPKDAEAPFSPLEPRPTQSKSTKAPSSKRVAALAGASEPLSTELFGDSNSDSELSEVNTNTPGSKKAVGVVPSKTKAGAGAGASKRKRVELDEGDEDPNAVVAGEGGDEGDTVVDAPTPKKKMKKTKKDDERPPAPEQDPMDLDVDMSQEEASGSYPSSFPPPPPKQSVPKNKYSVNKKKPTSSKSKSKRDGKTTSSRSPFNNDEDEEDEPDPYDDLPTATSERGLVNLIASERETKSKVTLKPTSTAKKGRAPAGGTRGGKRKKVDEQQQDDEDEEDDQQDDDLGAQHQHPPKKSTTTATAASSKKKAKKTVASIEEEPEPPKKKEKEKSEIKIQRGGGAAGAGSRKRDDSTTPDADGKKKKNKDKDKTKKEEQEKEKEADTSMRSTRSSTRKSALAARKKFAVDNVGSEDGEEEEEEEKEGEDEEEEEFVLKEGKGRKMEKEVRGDKEKGKRKEKKLVKEPTPEPVAPYVEEYAYPGDDDGFANDDGGGEGDATITAPTPTKGPAKVGGGKPQKKPVVHLDAISEREESEWMSDARGEGRTGSSKGPKGFTATGSSAKIKEVDTNVPASKKDPKQKSLAKSPSDVSSKVSVSTSDTARRSSKTTSMPPSIQRAKKSDFGPWEQPDTVQERLEANLAAEGMEDILEEAHSEVAGSETATERGSDYGNEESPRRKGPRTSSKAPSIASIPSPAHPAKEPGNRVVDSDEDEFEDPKETKSTSGGRSTRRNSSAVVESFSAGPLAHSTPKPPPITPKERRPQPNMEIFGQQQQSSSSKVKPKSKGAAAVDAKTMGPSSAGPSKQRRVLPRSNVGASESVRLPGAQPSTLGTKKAAEGAASSSKQNSNLDPRSSHTALPSAPLLASKSRSATPFVVKSANRGLENAGAVAGLASSARKQKRSVYRTAQERMDDGEEKAPLVSQTFDVIADELSKRYIKRIKKTQAQAKEVQTRLVSDTQKLAHHLVNRTGVIVDASKRHAGVLKELNKNVGDDDSFVP